MSYIVDFFKSLADIITACVDFLMQLITGLVDFFVSLPEYVDIVTDYIEMLPEPMLVIATLVLAASLIFVIIGRRGV